MNDSSDKGKSGSTPIIRKIKRNKHKHHGGSWKIAFADFVTAMMAFFLLMWLIASLNKAQKDGIAEYFKQPMKITFFGGENVGNQQINLKGGGPNLKDTNGQISKTDKSSPQSTKEQNIQVIQSNKEETQKLEELKSQINLSIQQDPSLAGLKNQLLMEVVKDGLRIQLIDNQKNPCLMWDPTNSIRIWSLFLFKLPNCLKMYPIKLPSKGIPMPIPIIILRNWSIPIGSYLPKGPMPLAALWLKQV